MGVRANAELGVRANAELGVRANAKLGVRANAELGVIANVRTLQNNCKQFTKKKEIRKIALVLHGSVGQMQAFEARISFLLLALP